MDNHGPVIADFMWLKMIRTVFAVCFVVACGCNETAEEKKPSTEVSNVSDQTSQLNRASTPNPFQSKSFVENGEWTTWSDTRISMRMPANWTVSSSTDEFEKDRTHYEVADEKGVCVIRMTQSARGLNWENVFSCIPEDLYEFAELSGYKFWQVFVDMLPDEPGGKSFSFKVASASSSLAGSAVLPDEHLDAKLIYIARSALTIE